jgi:hypothetical protein
MKLDWLHRRAREIVDQATAEDADRDFERLLVGDAVVAREGDHYRIERGGETWEELERLARSPAACAACGRPWGGDGEPAACPRCGDRRDPGSS